MPNGWKGECGPVIIVVIATEETGGERPYRHALTELTSATCCKLPIHRAKEMEEVEIDPKEADLLGFRCQSANQ